MRAPYFEAWHVTAWLGDAGEVLRRLPDRSVDGVLTSPPYLDQRPEVDAIPHAELSVIFKELTRVVAGPVLLNVGRVWRNGREQLWWLDVLGLAQSAGLDLVDTRVWLKPNANPIKGRVFTDSHEYVFVLCAGDCQVDVDEARTPYSDASVGRMARNWHGSRGVKYGDPEDSRRPGRPLHPKGARPRSYFESYTGREKGIRHPSPMALDAAVQLVVLAAPHDGVVLDPLAGSGTTALACLRTARKAVLIERNRDYLDEAAERLTEAGHPPRVSAAAPSTPSGPT